MNDQFMTIEQWSASAVRARVYRYFTDGFRLPDITQPNDNLDKYKLVRDSLPSR